MSSFTEGGSGGVSTADASSGGLSNVPSNTDELYDRQIRLWGASAQSLLLNSHVLFLGPKCCVVECLKNTVLAGVKVTICTLDYDRGCDSGDPRTDLETDTGTPNPPTNSPSNPPGHPGLYANDLVNEVKQLNPYGNVIEVRRHNVA